MVIIKLVLNYIVSNVWILNVCIAKTIIIYVNYVKLLILYKIIFVLFKIVNKWETTKNVKNVYKVMFLRIMVLNVKSLIAIKQRKY